MRSRIRRGPSLRSTVRDRTTPRISPFRRTTILWPFRFPIRTPGCRRSRPSSRDRTMCSRGRCRKRKPDHSMSKRVWHRRPPKAPHQRFPPQQTLERVRRQVWTATPQQRPRRFRQQVRRSLLQTACRAQTENQFRFRFLLRGRRRLRKQHLRLVSTRRRLYSRLRSRSHMQEVRFPLWARRRLRPKRLQHRGRERESPGQERCCRQSGRDRTHRRQLLRCHLLNRRCREPEKERRSSSGRSHRRAAPRRLRVETNTNAAPNSHRASV